MLNTGKTRKQEGFTIIEVLIVLAIAGLILLVVFLAVPALQRNSRNTQSKSAAAAVLATTNEFVSSNNGAQPTAVNILNGTITVSSTAAGTTSVTGKTQGGYTASVGTAMPTTPGTYVLYLNRKCNGNAFATTATNRAFAVGYVIETASGTVAQCTES